MADGIELNAGSGGATIATDDDGTFQWPYTKLAFGADNTQTIVGSTSSNPLPVALSDTDNAVLDSIQTAVELIDNAISGAGFNITQLGGAAVPIGAGLEATALRVTLATDSTGVVSIDDNGGSLTVDGTVATTNGGTFAVQEDGAALTALQLIDNTVYVDDADWTALTSSHNLIGGIYQSSPGSITDGDTGPIRLTANGAVHISDAGGSITVDGTVSLSATDNAVLDQIDSNTDYGAVVGGGAEATALRVTIANDSTGVVSIDDNAGSLTVDNSGTFVVQEDGAALTALQLIDNPIVAHDAAASGASGVSMIGGYATNSIEGLTQVANADAARIISDLNGCLVTRPHTTLEEIIVERVSDTAGTSAAFTNFSAGGAGVHNYITTLAVWNSSATDGYVDIRDGTAGTILFTLPAPKLGGSVVNLPVPLKQTTANTALAYDVSGALSTIYLSAVGFQAQG